MTIYPSLLAFLLAVGPFVNDPGKLVQWQDQKLQLYGLQLKSNPQVIYALELVTLLTDLRVLLFTPNMVQRKAVDNWMRMVTTAVTDSNGDYLYGLLIGQASSRTNLAGDATFEATMTKTMPASLIVAGDASITADITVTP